MIEHIETSLLDVDCAYICHQVNCQGKMNSGVARAIRQKWRVVYETYIEVYDEHVKNNNGMNYLLGKILSVEVPTKQTVINMFSQFDYGYDGARYTSYDAFWNCLEHIKSFVPKGSRIAFPYKIGCCRGGADWEVIEKMIERVLGDDYHIIICHLEEDK